MAETLKKYRVKTVDGQIRFVMAKNIHDAKSKARLEVGQLPNEVNLKIVKRALAEFQEIIDTLTSMDTKLKQSGKDLEWNLTNSQLKEISKYLEEKSTSISQLAGSMVRINTIGA